MEWRYCRPLRAGDTKTAGYAVRKPVGFVRVLEITTPPDVMNIGITSRFLTWTTALSTRPLFRPAFGSDELEYFRRDVGS